METVQSEAFPLNPIWDQMMAERDGREPHQFKGHEIWADSEEAQQAYERGLVHAAATEVEFFGGLPGERFRKVEFPNPTPTCDDEEPNGWDSDAAEKALAEFRAAKRVSARAQRNRRRKS